MQNGYKMSRDGCFHVFDKTLIIFNQSIKQTSTHFPSLVGEVLREILEVILFLVL